MKRLTLIFLIISFLPYSFLPCFPDSMSYSYVMDLGKENYQKGLFLDALHYFKLANAMQPYALEPQKYIEAIQENSERPFIQEVSSVSTATSAGQGYLRAQNLKDNLDAQRKKKMNVFLDKFSKSKIPRITEKGAKETAAIKKEIITEEQKKHKKPKYTLILEGKDKSLLPLTLELSLEDCFIIRSNNLKRYLSVSPDVVSVDKPDKSTLIINAEKFGSTFFHVWDDDRRFTFNIRVIPALRVSEREKDWQPAEGFTFWYNSNWDSYYKGRRMGDMERKSLLFNQDGGLRGPTPYGKFDASVSWSKSNATEEISGYTVGLEKGHIGNFKDFNLRSFDFTKPFSDLTFPGNTLRGFSFESPAFNHAFEYTVIYGREKRYFQSALFPGVVPREDTYVEGLRLGFFPRAKNRLYINYAHGYGDDRENFLKSKVFSLQTEHNFNPFHFYSEFASDEDAVAARIVSQVRLPKFNFKVSLRDVEKKFVNIVSRPPNVGQLGSLFEVNWFPRKYFSLSSSLDVYRDRLLFNPARPGAVNHDWNAFANLSLPRRYNLNTSIFYSNAPGLSSPHRSLTAQTILNKIVDVDLPGVHSLSGYLGYNYQNSINPLSQISDFERSGVLGGLRFFLTPDVSLYTNYNYSWLKELSQDLSDTPSVRETGIDFFHAFSPNFSSNIRVYYRDEEKADALHSFLSGEDSMEGNINFTYTPHRDTQFFLDGRVRNVWAENHGTEKFIEADIRLGARILWESFFSWAPSAKIEGYVYKDANGNGKKDAEEEGVPGVKIILGPKKVVTDAKGRFSAAVRAKKIKISLEPSTLPQGYVPTTSVSLELDTSGGLKQEISFGISTQTGIYGMVFYDSNTNGRFDKDEKPLAKAKVKLDSERTAITDAKGVYFFGGLASGMHTVALDVNSLPLEYVPTTSIKAKIDVSEGITSLHNFPLRKK